MSAVLVVVGALLFLGGNAFFAGERPAGVGSARPSSGEGTGAAAADTPAPAREVPAPRPARVASENTAELLVRIRSAGRGPITGEIFWRTGRRPPTTADVLVQERRTEPRVDSLSHTGLARLPVPRGQWTWLRITARRAGGRLAGAFRRVPPFEGRREIDIDLDRSQRRLHVFVLGSDLSGPAAGEDVRLYVRSLRSTAAPELHATRRTDPWGYTTFADLPPGGFLLVAPGARLGDRPPQVRYTIMTEGQGCVEYPVTLVAAEARTRVRLKVFARIERPFGPTPRLVLERQDDGPGRAFPLRESLQEGSHEYGLEVPPGRYRLAVQPQGALEVHGADRVLLVQDVEQVQAFEVAVSAKATATRVRLLGVPASAFPVQVSRIPRDRSLDDPGNLSFVGPYRWPSAEQVVVGSLGPGRLTALGGRGVWISKSEVTIVGQQAGVAMMPAARIEIRWRAPGRRHAEAEIETVFGSRIVVMRRQLVNRDGVIAPSLVGYAVVPRSRVRIDGLGERGGTTLWTREVDAVHPFEVVTVDE